MKKYLIKISWDNGTSLTKYFYAETERNALRTANNFANRIKAAEVQVDSGKISVNRAAYLI